jgi:uncharacterized protein (DUF1697 family)
VTTHIAFFRGINAGGKNSLRMKELVAIKCGKKLFATLINLTAEVKRRRGFKPHVVILRLGELKNALKKNPFPDAQDDPSTLHLSFLTSKPKRPDLQQLTTFNKVSERFRLGDGVFYLHLPDGTGRSNLAANAERLVGVPMPVRNRRTVCKVLEIAEQLQAH